MIKESEELITVRDLMKMLSISRATAYRYMERKMFEVYRFEGNVRIGKQSVLDYLSKHKR